MQLIDNFPLYTRFAALRSIPRVRLCALPSPIERAVVDGATIWIKSDGLNAPVCGGNKVRALEFLLARVRPGDTIVTAGGEGSTHVLATAIHARTLGARVIGVRWRHEMNAAARDVSEMIATVGEPGTTTYLYDSPITALIRAQIFRLTSNVLYIPPGGSTPLGILAHVNAALELAEQIGAGELPVPMRVVVPLGTGGTAAGLALGFAIAGLEVTTIAVQVTPLLVANRFRVQRLMSRTAALIERTTGECVPIVTAQRFAIARGAFGGAYGRPLPAADDAASALDNATGIRLDDTYSAKAFAVALSLAHTERGPTLFWNTFDSRLLRRRASCNSQARTN
ncbi:MAG: pyridoxal-phosphate dependent enzyme [Gemmatimonadota bacterium]|nr:pyridoxal-phosphate dependent enzyme [Gemmatimonadota bacterium]